MGFLNGVCRHERCGIVVLIPFIFLNGVCRHEREDGVTHMNKQGELCSGNLRGYVQYRHLLPNNTNWKFDYNERMALFK